MKIAIVHTDFRIYWPARLKALNDFLKSKRISLDIIEIAGKGSPYAFAGKSNDEKLNWHILFPEDKMEDIKSSSIQKKLYSLLDKINPDVIIAGAIAFPSGALSVSWANRHKKKVICFDDAKIDSVQRSGIVNYIKQQIYNGVYAMLYPSQNWDETGRFWHFNKEQLFYGIDVVDNSFWSDYAAIYQNKSNTKFFLAVGRMIPVKNFLYVTESYKKYHDIYKESSYHIIFVGEGPERIKIQQYIDQYDLKGYVELLPFKNQKELREIYHNSQALILSSIKETWGLVINEAMACGLPIIASKECGATNTLVRDKINGYVFSPEKSEELLYCLCQFHNLSENQKRDMGNASLKIIQDWDLSRFCKGCYDAIIYASKQPVKKISLLNNIIIKLWKGQYRPI